MKTALRRTALLSSLLFVAACGGIQFGGDREEVEEIDIEALSEEEAEQIAAEQIDESNFDEQLEEVLKEIEAEDG